MRAVKAVLGLCLASVACLMVGWFWPASVLLLVAIFAPLVAALLEV
jgi:hypothetical protein